MWQKWTTRGRRGRTSSDPDKGCVKGHSSPAGVGERPRGLMLACMSKGEVLRYLLSGVAAHCLENKGCPVTKDDTGGGASAPDRVHRNGPGEFPLVPQGGQLA